nr:immunoglobulin heavy chain junction region [Macaca mulatta]MOX91843.1 immunoglobulin heavy chain junction region [Macaca mulatta]MOX91880.1 immunoglobulin heavy chain junction region [Macaca mulatta]MOX92513.1 immunoglobulin heavy chain junction region [Macaca mulatta]MOX92746.1 immunoglobulin heavy chain junction region [Macaca mulatta]
CARDYRTWVQLHPSSQIVVDDYYFDYW